VVLQRLGRVQQFLETHEDLLPVRAAWLAWLAVVKLARGDVLALARARDRLLERLFKSGLSPDQDLPSFLHLAGSRDFREWLTRLPALVQGWLRRINIPGLDADPADTGAYADLILAFGLARVGERQECQKRVQQAKEWLAGGGDVPSVLLEAYVYRVDQGLGGKAPGGPLPAALVEYLEHMEKIPRYMVDRVRQHSRILEPVEKVQPYRHWQSWDRDPLGGKLAALPDIADRDELARRLHTLLETCTKKGTLPDVHARVLEAALDLAPRAGEQLAQEALGRIGQVVNQVPEVSRKAALIEKGLRLAAHFNQADRVQECVGLFQALLRDPAAGTGHALASLADESFRGLRKLGMRDEIDTLLRQLAMAILQGRPLPACRDQPDWPDLLCSMLHVAAGWYYFGKDAQAKPVVEEVRRQLFRNNLPRPQQTRLACTYVGALAQAPVELALKAIEELFEKLDGIHDTFTTNAHFGLSQLDLVEAVVLAVVTDEFAADPMARHWLEDDEFLVRRRIHRDVHAAVSQTPL
jgi:hypothetical protein